VFFFFFSEQHLLYTEIQDSVDEVSRLQS